MQSLREQCAHLSNISQKVLFFNDTLDFECSSTACREALIGVAVDEGTKGSVSQGSKQISSTRYYSRSSLFDGFNHLVARQQSSNWCIAAAEGLANRLDIGHNSFLLPCV